MKKILIFGGTTEGRSLAEYLSCFSVLVTVSVATDYGETLLPKGEHIKTLAKRMVKEEMVLCLEKERFDNVIDATHPFAQEVSKNILFACTQTNTPYLRLKREEKKTDSTGVVTVGSIKEAADYLKTTKGKVLLTTGSKELLPFTDIENFKDRLFPRVLPTPGVVQKCYDLGFDAKHLICMQGPFTKECNTAMLKQIGADYLVTKESGDIGGFYEKMQAAQEAGVVVITIGRPKEEGYPFDEIASVLKKDLMLKEKEKTIEPVDSTPKYFPLFVNLTGKKVLVVGGGAIAKRRIETLKEFGCDICVIAPVVCEGLKNSSVKWVERPYQKGDCNGYDMVLAAVDKRSVNHTVYEECTERSIPVNIGDCKEECSFYFPAIAQEGSVVIGITTSGENHRLNKEIAQTVRKNLSELILDMGEKNVKNN